MNDNYWHLIYNKLKILIDPNVFAGRNTIEKQVSLVTMLKDYLKKIDPSLCDVEFYYPKDSEEKLGIRNVFNEYDKEVIFTTKPKKIENVFFEFVTLTDIQREIYNEMLSVAIENKIPYFLCDLEITNEQQRNFEKKYNISLINIAECENIISYFLQGFYNYYKFDKPLYGIDNAGMAHAMSDDLHRKMNIFHSKVSQNNNFSDEIKERTRSFVHNRYIDILVTIDKIYFYKIQQRLFDIRNNISENREPHFSTNISYYLNYYYLLLWGYMDHFAIVVNDIFCLGYDSNSYEDQKKMGLKDTKGKKDFLEKIKNADYDLYKYIVSDEFQEWLFVLQEIRNKIAHREMLSIVPLLGQTPESDIEDDEIDKILYKDKDPINKETFQAFVNTVGIEYAQSTVEYQKALDRIHYKISKTDKILDYFISFKKDGKLSVFDPVARLYIDKEKIEKMTTLLLDAYNTKNTQTSTP